MFKVCYNLILKCSPNSTQSVSILSGEPNSSAATPAATYLLSGAPPTAWPSTLTCSTGAARRSRSMSNMLWSCHSQRSMWGSWSSRTSELRSLSVSWTRCNRITGRPLQNTTNNSLLRIKPKISSKLSNRKKQTGSAAIIWRNFLKW